jgi:hypothetical protein
LPQLVFNGWSPGGSLILLFSAFTEAPNQRNTLIYSGFKFGLGLSPFVIPAHPSALFGHTVSGSAPLFPPLLIR